MCGLYGFTTRKDHKLTPPELADRGNILSALALAMQTRGEDSTGVCGVRDGKTTIFKKTEPASKFVRLKKYLDIAYQPSNTVTGHTRLATTGEVNHKNAHPLKYRRIIGTHNGIINNYRIIKKQAEVDTMSVLLLLEKNEAKKAFKEVSGSCALVWLDTDNLDNLYLVAHENPIYIANTPELKSLFYCSEDVPLITAITACGYQISDLWGAKSNYIYTIDDKLKIKKSKVEFKGGRITYFNDYKNFNAEDQVRVDTADDVGVDFEELEYACGNGCQVCSSTVQPEIDGVYYDPFHQSVICVFCYIDASQTKNFLYHNPINYKNIKTEYENYLNAIPSTDAKNYQIEGSKSNDSRRS